MSRHGALRADFPRAGKGALQPQWAPSASYMPALARPRPHAHDRPHSRQGGGVLARIDVLATGWVTRKGARRGVVKMGGGRSWRPYFGADPSAISGLTNSSRPPYRESGVACWAGVLGRASKGASAPAVVVGGFHRALPRRRPESRGARAVRSFAPRTLRARPKSLGGVARISA